MSHTQRQRKVIFATSLGNCLEIFDFTVYSFFASVIGKIYFPSDNEYTSWLLALATFGIGFLMRPLGGFLIGNYSDRVGRKAGLTLTISLMSLGTALIAFAPTYAQVGIAGPIFLVLGRLIQGFSAGGEFGAATTFLMESAKPNNRGFMVSWQYASQGLATILGALFAMVILSNLSEQDVQAWGWRIPFVFGLLIMPIGFYIRNQLDETFSFPERKKSAIVEVFAEHRPLIMIGILMLMGGIVANYTMNLFLPSYLIKTLNIDKGLAQYSSIVSGITIAIMTPLFGKLTDRFPNRKKYLIVTTTLSYLYIYPSFWIMRHYPEIEIILLVVFIKAILGSTGSAAFFLAMMESFPAKVRVSGLAIIYATAAAIFGGSAQFIVVWLLKVTGNPMAPAWYMLFCSTISFIALFNLKIKTYNH